MHFLKRISIYILMILLFVSLYFDMVKGNDQHETSVHHHDTHKSSKHEPFQVVKVQIQPGDTVLSISEHINHIEHLQINQLIEDFRLLNPYVDPYELETHAFYYFPHYAHSP